MEEEEWDDDFVVAPIAVEAPKQSVPQGELLPVVTNNNEIQSILLNDHTGVGVINEETFPLPSVPVTAIHQEEDKKKISLEIEEPTAAIAHDQTLSSKEHDNHLGEASTVPVTTLFTTHIPDILSDGDKTNVAVGITSETVITIEEQAVSDIAHVGEDSMATKIGTHDLGIDELTETHIPDVLSDSEKANIVIGITSETVITIEEQATTLWGLNEAPMVPVSDITHTDEVAVPRKTVTHDLGIEEATETTINEEIDLDAIASKSAPVDTHIDELEPGDNDIAPKQVNISVAAETQLGKCVTANSILPSNILCDDDAADSLVEQMQWEGDDNFETAAVPTTPATISDVEVLNDEIRSLSPLATAVGNEVGLQGLSDHEQEEKPVVVKDLDDDEDEWADFEGPVSAPPITTTVAAVSSADLADDRRLTEPIPAAIGSTVTYPNHTEQIAAPAVNNSHDPVSTVMRSVKIAHEVDALRSVLPGDSSSLYASFREKCANIFGGCPPLTSFPGDQKLPWDIAELTDVGAATAAAARGSDWAGTTSRHCVSVWSEEEVRRTVMATIPADGAAFIIEPRYMGLWLWISNAKSHWSPSPNSGGNQASTTTTSAGGRTGLVTSTSGASAARAGASSPFHATHLLPPNSFGQDEKRAPIITTVTMLPMREASICPSSPPQSPPFSPPSSPRQKIQLQPSSHTRPIDANGDKSLGIDEWGISEGKRVMPSPLPPPLPLPSSGTSSSSSSSLSSSASAGMRKLFSSFGSLPTGDTKKPPSVTGTSTSSGSSGESDRGISFERGAAASNANASARSSSSSSGPLPPNGEVAGPFPNVVAARSSATDAFEDFDALFGGSDVTATSAALPIVATPKSGGLDPNFFMFEPEISPAVTSFLQTLPDFSYVLKT